MEVFEGELWQATNLRRYDERCSMMNDSIYWEKLKLTDLREYKSSESSWSLTVSAAAMPVNVRWPLTISNENSGILASLIPEVFTELVVATSRRSKAG